jgi:hypothetical protein
MATRLTDMLDRLPPARRRRVEARAGALIAEEMSLRDLRKAMRKMQVELAPKTGKLQVTLSQLEWQSDMLTPCLRLSPGQAEHGAGFDFERGHARPRRVPAHRGGATQPPAGLPDGPRRPQRCRTESGGSRRCSKGLGTGSGAPAVAHHRPAAGIGARYRPISFPGFGLYADASYRRALDLTRHSGRRSADPESRAATLTFVPWMPAFAGITVWVDAPAGAEQPRSLIQN